MLFYILVGVLYAVIWYALSVLVLASDRAQMDLYPIVVPPLMIVWPVLVAVTLVVSLWKQAFIRFPQWVRAKINKSLENKP